MGMRYYIAKSVAAALAGAILPLALALPAQANGRREISASEMQQQGQATPTGAEGQFPPAPNANGANPSPSSQMPNPQIQGTVDSNNNWQNQPNNQGQNLQLPLAPVPDGGQADAQPNAAAQGNAPAGDNSGGAALWPSVAAQQVAPAQNNGQPSAPNSQNAAPVPPVNNANNQYNAVPPAQPYAPNNAQAVPADVPQNGKPQTVEQLQDEVNALKNRINQLETNQSNAPANQPANAAPMQNNSFGQAAPLAKPQTESDDESYIAPANANPDTLYQLGTDFMAKGLYAKGAIIWSSFVDRFAQDPRAAQAAFNLGECYYARGLYGQAAQAYLKVRNSYKDSAIAPRSLLRLALSMANLQDNSTACALLVTMAREYPKADADLLNQARQESATLQCP